MPKLEIKNHRTGSTIYEGHFQNAKECIEQAVHDNVCLDYADLHHANLSNASLDDAVMRHARLDFVNLSGANLSEARLDGASFYNATLHATCLCYSSLENTRFDHALFGATDITGCPVIQARFSGLSAFTLNFVDAHSIDRCIYRASSGIPCPFSTAPLVINGRDMPVIFLDRHLIIGSLAKTYNEWLQHTNDNAPNITNQNAHIYSFFNQYRAYFETIYGVESVKSHPKKNYA